MFERRGGDEVLLTYRKVETDNRRVARLIFAFLLFVVLVGAAGASVLPTPPVAIVSSERSGDPSVYHLKVTERGRHFIVVVPYGARTASLEVNGVEQERVGYDIPVGAAPFGHGMATFPLTNVRPTDRVVVRVFGSHEKLLVLDESGTTASAHAIGLLSGAYYAVLGIVAFFIIVALCIVPDQTMAWYLCYTVSLILIELTRDDVLPFTQAANAVCLLAAIALSTLAVVGFYVSYLRLRTEAPRLIYALGFWTVAPWLLNAAFLAATHRPLDGEAMVPPITVVLVACIAIAAIRRRAGYKPATYIVIGFFGLVAALFSDDVRSALHAPSPFLDRWQIELGSTFDTLAFAVAVTLRSRYSERQRASDLVTASFEAGHDALTGLLNRRGLEGCFAGLEEFVSTVLFIDLDDFKKINDRGGHAAGDDALKIMARILRNAVRTNDIVARVGGDEFVVVLCNNPTSPGVAAVMERISAAVADVHPLGKDDPTRFGVSIGRAETETGKPFSAAVAAADADAYRIKIEHHANSRIIRQRDPETRPDR
jgi:diguanylate cyclase (GGDEF)-like protein